MKCNLTRKTIHYNPGTNERRVKESQTEFHRTADAQREMLKDAAQLVDMGYILEEIKTGGYKAYKPYAENGEYITKSATIAI